MLDNLSLVKAERLTRLYHQGSFSRREPLSSPRWQPPHQALSSLSECWETRKNGEK